MLSSENCQNEVKLFSAEKIYAWLMDNPLSDDDFAKLKRAFEADSHDIWYLRSSSAFAQSGEGEDGPGSKRRGGLRLRRRSWRGQ